MYVSFYFHMIKKLVKASLVLQIQIQMGICRARLTNCPGALTNVGHTHTRELKEDNGKKTKTKLLAVWRPVGS